MKQYQNINQAVKLLQAFFLRKSSNQMFSLLCSINQCVC